MTLLRYKKRQLFLKLENRYSYLMFVPRTFILISYGNTNPTLEHYSIFFLAMVFEYHIGTLIIEVNTMLFCGRIIYPHFSFLVVSAQSRKTFIEINSYSTKFWMCAELWIIPIFCCVWFQTVRWKNNPHFLVYSAIVKPQEKDWYSVCCCSDFFYSFIPIFIS